MSVVTKAKFKCPNCGEEFEGDLYKAVTRQDDESYRHKLVNGEYFKYICPKCGKPFMAVYPLSYTDVENKFMLQYAPNKIKDEVMEMVKKERVNLPQDYTVRLTTATYDLVEKMIIFENRFDDRAIEINKVIIHKAFLEKFENKKVHHIYFNKDQNGNFVFDVIYVGDDDKQLITRANFDVKLYNKIYRDFRKDFSDDDLFIDYGYGLNKISTFSTENKESEENKQ